jgi:hypothetical protein
VIPAPRSDVRSVHEDDPGHEPHVMPAQ